MVPRFLPSRRRGGSGAGLLAIGGIAIGVTTLIVVLAVMNGFQRTTIESILELNSYHLRVETDRSLGEVTPTLPDLLSAINAVPGVAVVSPVVELQTLARGLWPDAEGIILRGVPEDWLTQDVGAAERLEIVTGSFSLQRPGTVVLGAELARSMAVRPGDTIAVTHLPGGGGQPREERLLVTGLFRSEYLDFDRSWGFISLATAQEVLASQDPVVLGIKLHRQYEDLPVLQEVGAVVPYPVVSWRHYNRGIFGALRMEKSMMTFLMGMMFLVVGGNIYQMLRRNVLERREEMAILRALGCTLRDIRTIFLLQGGLIGIVGTVLGGVLGVTLSLRVNQIFDALERLTASLAGGGVRVFSPAYFYLTAVPVRIIPQELALIMTGAVGIAVAAAWLAALNIGRVGVQEVLRSE